MKTVSIIIPCYNECATIVELLSRVERADFGNWKKEILIVDDGSQDGTRDILDEYKNKSGYQIIFHEKNGGKGVAERTAIARAIGDYLILQDADLEYDPCEIKKLLDVVDETGAPIVFGSRNLETHWHRIKDFFAISVGVWGSTKFVNLLYGTHLTDAWTCYKLFSREVSRRAHFIGNGFEADYLFIGDASVNGFPIIEVPISHSPRTVEEGKKIRYKDGIYSMIRLLGHRLIHLRKNESLSLGREERMQKIRQYLQCPFCQSAILMTKSAICEKGHKFELSATDIPMFADKESLALYEEEHLSGVNWLKSFLKQFPALYYGLWRIFCPVLMIQNGPKRLFRRIKTDSLVADIGSGPERISKQVINIDIFPFPGVDIIASANNLPFNNAMFDGLITESLLEHVPNPKEVSAELLRVLKPGGVVYASAPFITPYHASPDDFNRFTTSGLKELFPDCDVIEVGVRSGPWSAFLVFLAYWLGIIFSFGSRRIAPFMAFIFMLVLGPLKFFDLLFSYIPGAEAVSAQLYIIARKR